MKRKSRLVKALDEFDSDGSGVRRSDFLRWIKNQKNWENEEPGRISKLLFDCIDDEWVGQKTEQEIDPSMLPQLGTSESLPMMSVEYIYVRSRGREITKWWYLYPAILEKMSAKELLLIGITTGVTIFLAYLGITGE